MALKVEGNFWIKIIFFFSRFNLNELRFGGLVDVTSWDFIYFIFFHSNSISLSLVTIFFLPRSRFLLISLFQLRDFVSHVWILRVLSQVTISLFLLLLRLNRGVSTRAKVLNHVRNILLWWNSKETAFNECVPRGDSCVICWCEKRRAGPLWNMLRHFHLNWVISVIHWIMKKLMSLNRIVT